MASSESSPFEWLIGYSHFDSVTGATLGTTTPLFADPNTLERITNVPTRLNTDIHAVFGSFSVPVTDRLNIGGEIRYTDEEQILVDEAQIFFFPALSRPPTETPASFQYWSGKASVDFALTDDILLYGYAGRRVKSGGANPGAIPGFETFQSETNWIYELGVKSTLWGGRAVVNAAFYYIDWTELQTTAPTSLAAGPVVVNGVGATSRGIEIDATVDVTENFTVRLATTYLDPTYDDGFVDAAVEQSCGANAAANILVSVCSADVSGNQIARTSDFQLFLSGTYMVPDLAFGFDGYARVDFSHEAAIFPQSLNILEHSSRNLVNLRFGFRNENTELAFWVDNVADADLIDRVTSVSDLEASASCLNCGVRLTRNYRGNGRTWGAKVVQRF